MRRFTRVVLFPGLLCLSVATTSPPCAEEESARKVIGGLETSDPLGAYLYRAVVSDKVTGKSVILERKISLVE